ncbi:FAD-dependent oxidoreductase [candidate division KSB1 bacterium]|nr:FAD-dependent oxidoreductase [candidate division KSB1 bacterium]
MDTSIRKRTHIALKIFIILVLAPTVLVGSEGSYANGKRNSDSQKDYYYKPVESGAPRIIECDVAIYGGTPAGVSAAIQVARMGKKAVLLSFNRHVGGMTSGGLTATDIGDEASVGGLAMEFYRRMGKIRNFRPSEAESLYVKMLNESGVEILFERCLQSVNMKNNKLLSAAMETGETIKASMFLDTTYEGDLFAAANVSYRVGREPTNAYKESLAGQWQNLSWKDTYQFCRLPISPYLDSNDPNSGLLPEISSESPGHPGDGDYKVQAYNFRMFLTDGSERIPFPKPAGYDPDRYALLARFLNFDSHIEWTLNYTQTPMEDGPVQVKNGDCNNAGSFSSDYVGGNYRWPDGTYQSGSFKHLPPARRGLQIPLRELYEVRERIFQDHVNYQQGLMFFLANDPHVPTALRDRVNQFGLDQHEFPETGNWPHQLYIREGRRMVSNYVVTQANCESTLSVHDPIGLASYPMDSHFCQRVVVIENGTLTVRNEGGFGYHCPKPYPVPYRAIIPKDDECVNLLVPVCLSSSHVAYGSIRMEPVFMILGQSAGTAACIAIDDNVSVQEVDYNKLKKRLLLDGQKL